MVSYFLTQQYVTCVIRTMGRAKISLEKEIEIKVSLKAGFSQRYIDKSLNVSRTCVRNVAKKLKQSLPLSNSN